MGEENKTGPVTEAIQPDAEAKTPKRVPRKSSPQRKAAGESIGSGSVGSAEAKNPAAKSRKFNQQDRIEKLSGIEAQVAKGTSTLRDAIKSAGISEQTYYQWKRSTKPAELPTKAAASGDADLTDFIELETENKRLRKLLAEKLRSENSDLRRRLGLD